MKYYSTLVLTLMAMLASLSALAQTPKRFSYQAVVRGSLQELIADRQVLVRASILEQTATGPAVYVEEHTPTTNKNGLLTIQIGGGRVVSGDFDKIKWAKGNFFLETRIDLENRDITNNPIIGVSQLLSVPYAIYAQQADSTRHALYADSVRGHQIGDLFGGGIIFSLWRDRRGVQHGLIASVSDLGSRAWATPDLGGTATSTTDGAANTAAIVSARGAGTAAGLCDAYIVLNGNQPPITDWYLPAVAELMMLYNQAPLISRVLESDTEATSTGLNGSIYWSSTFSRGLDSEGKRASYGVGFGSNGNDELLSGSTGHVLQSSSSSVRAIRRF